jgi:hypothetical protein
MRTPLFVWLMFVVAGMSILVVLSPSAQWHEVKDAILCFDFAASRRSLS